MSNYTEHYNLKKPLKTESYDVDVANTNNDIIDEKLYGKVDKVAGKGLSENDFTDGYKKKVDNLVEGIKGDSAYQIAVQNGFEGSETDWLTSLKGSDGKQGIQGEKGESNILTIGTVKKGEEASASVTGESPNQKLNLVLPKGDTGGKGEKGDTPIKGTDYFTEQEIQAIKNSILSQVNQFNIQVVQQLPTGKIDTHTIYFVPKASQKQNDIYEEYIYINNSWEHIGTLETNLSDYYTKDEINDKVDGKTIPAGGTVGQILTKKSDTDYDTQWQNPIDEMYYKAGDTYLTSTIIVAGGYVTSGKKQLWFSVTLPKRLDNITKVNITSLDISVRSVTGTYILDNQSLPTSSMGVEIRIADNNTITLVVSKTSDFYQTNNTPIGVQINTLELSFN